VLQEAAVNAPSQPVLRWIAGLLEGVKQQLHAGWAAATQTPTTTAVSTTALAALAGPSLAAIPATQITCAAIVGLTAGFLKWYGTPAKPPSLPVYIAGLAAAVPLGILGGLQTAALLGWTGMPLFGAAAAGCLAAIGLGYLAIRAAHSRNGVLLLFLAILSVIARFYLVG
jgi:hypothetical protein